MFEGLDDFVPILLSDLIAGIKTKSTDFLGDEIIWSVNWALKIINGFIRLVRYWVIDSFW